MEKVDDIQSTIAIKPSNRRGNSKHRRMLPIETGPRPDKEVCSVANMNYDVYAIHCLS